MGIVEKFQKILTAPLKCDKMIKILGLKPVEGDVPIDSLDRFVEAGACGTAAVISPIGGIQHGDDFHVFYSETEVGPVTRKLYDELTGIQFGDIEAPEGWIVKVD